ncbi:MULTISPECIES: hypothetical protein [unclassified Polaromonas]|uniref:hypothetical protein n=1 Tax=unclassified Polaromonas TaxID=2638319 RepID=UPI000F081AD8|nr:MULTISPECIES: hypothetical protein [unclassified Polaromonas]AYQ26581.1 hypothetical protein DT070_00120 [Polaromonas sp. SP1]QGJ18572.1 hypothetical protein F7R28_09325 [Polaromonas sp. Pch-P]
MSQVPKIVQQRMIEALEMGRGLAARDFPEAELMGEAGALGSSVLFGDFVDLLLLQWGDLDNQNAAANAICEGFKRNSHREAFIHAVDALVEADINDFAPFAKALDSRAGDGSTSMHIRVEAVAGLTRLALRSSRWTTYAGAGVLRLLDEEDDWVKAKLCRLTSILHDQLAWDQAVESLKTLTSCTACAAEARQELGFVEMSAAFQSDNLLSMVAHLAQSATWFEQCARFAEDAPRARMYGVVAGALSKSLNGDLTAALDVGELGNDAQWVVNYGPPRAGASWLAPPVEAELEWIPLLAPHDGSAAVDPFSLFASAVQVFEKVRAVQVTINGKREYRAPSFSTLTERARAMGLGRTWLGNPTASNLSSEGRARLEAVFRPPGASPGKH